ncbi:protein transport protein Sec31A isoform X1 [Onthophagus taurus]|uniref:protein transport protein Sec31A isoform X1 n=1 Tax=Onthophagus taurus TaxID=166361 RepID=UPI0039BE1F4E
MKVKDLERMANIAWSPITITPIYLASGTAAQQFDASFSTNAALEIFSLNLCDPSSEMEQKSNVQSEHRFHKIIWGPSGGEYGTVIGGCDNGVIQIYNASKLLKNEPGLSASPHKHNGPVSTIDFNPFQGNLIASGASDSEIYIWDLNNTNSPMTPGAKSQPPEDVVSIQWNKQVEHILASTFYSKCVVWDLRKNEPIIKLTDTISRIRWKTVAWHPEVATQLCLASEEDQAPIIQLWDLRFATSPLKTLENHQRGVLSIAWCQRDADLLISSGKDSRILCWNPNSDRQGGEVLSEISRTSQWNFDVTWCPKNPALIATSGFDGHVSVFSLMGGKVAQIQTTNKIADSFPGMDGYVQAPVQQQNVAPISVDLSKPPKWLKRPVGASFGFGGKLITFLNEKPQPGVNVGVQTPTHLVTISQVVTETDLINKSMELESALEYGNFLDYCRNKADLSSDQHKKFIWHFIRANFEENPRAEILNLLGYRIDDLNEKLNGVVNNKHDIDQITDGFDNINAQGDEFEMISKSIEKKNQAKFKIETGDDSNGLITEAILMGNVEAAVELCIKANKYTEAIIIARTGTPDLFIKTQSRYLKQESSYLSSLISALVSEDWNTVVENCDIYCWKEALVGILTHCNDEDYPRLCEMLGNRLDQESATNPKFAKDAQLCYICSGSFDRLVHSWSGKERFSSDDLQELVELVMFLQRSIERQGKSVEITGGLADLLSNYAFILASQGSLQSALNYLGSSQNEKVAELRNRLHVSLGQKPGYVQRTQQRTSSTRTSFSNYAPQPIQNNQFPVPFSNQFNTNPINQQQQQQPWQAPPKPFSPAPPTQPPRPPSVTGTNNQSGGLGNRAKYVVDPSVQSNTYQRNQFNSNPISNLGQNQFNHDQFTNDISKQQFGNNLSQFPVVSEVSRMPNSVLNPVIPTPYVPGNTFSSANYPGQPPIEMGQSAINTLPKTSAPGWNDPPFFSKSRPQQKQEILPQDPITHPIYGSAPVAPINFPPPNQFNQQPQIQEPPPSNIFQPMMPPQQQQHQGGFNPSNFNTQAVTASPLGGQRVLTTQQIEKPSQPMMIQKPPIPEEHIHMQTVFDELRNKCSITSNNPQTKRKLEDVGRKLESLYDLLREHKLSPNTLQLLHQMVQIVQNGDYSNGLNLHTQMVSGPDFAQIASFMPGVKVLLQCALQLQVYIR